MIVPDASVIVSASYPRDLHHPVSLSWLEAYLLTGQGLAVPTLLLPEVGGALARQTGDVAIGHQVVQRVMAFPDVRVVIIDEQIGALATELAVDLRLRGADATYVAVAMHLQVPLISWDREQLERGGQRVIALRPDQA